eukprot:m.148817 g.148817  ORF g.148817 m.148817 type:complete len:68 (-) comp13264_c4_seq2:41-244(-)
MLWFCCRQLTIYNLWVCHHSQLISLLDHFDDMMGNRPLAVDVETAMTTFPSVVVNRSPDRVRRGILS